MAEGKKFYWLRLQKDFFKRHDIRIVEAMPNGKDYILFYLKLLVESVSHNGELRFNEAIPYSEEMLAVVTNTNVDIVRRAMEIFTQMDMIEILDDQTIFMNEVTKMIGSAEQDEHTRESTRNRVRAFRERQKALGIDENRYSNVTCNGELEKELEKELDIYTPIIESFNSICVSLPKAKLTDKRKKSLNARLKKYTADDLNKVFRLAEESDFLSGRSGDWKANIDWLLNENNMTKVLEGNYNNRKAKKNQFTSFENQNQYDYEAIEKRMCMK